jgi:DsbC/DsbD-like thiol-disulfide interchange protein
VKKLITVLSLLLFLQIAQPAESENKTATGLTRIQFVTDVSRVVPGEEITVALVLKPDTDFHIYWRGPGIVGVAPVIEWDLPKGFEPGSIEWPAPVKVDMVGIMANGFKNETWLLSTIRVPEKVVSEQIEIRAKIAWMACAATCHPGIERLSLTLPAGETAEKDETISKRFTKIRSQLPPPSPEGWSFSVSSPEANTIELDVVIPNLKWSDDTVIDFFCDVPVIVESEDVNGSVTGVPGVIHLRPAAFIGFIFINFFPDVFDNIGAGRNFLFRKKTSPVDAGLAYFAPIGIASLAGEQG